MLGRVLVGDKMGERRELEKRGGDFFRRLRGFEIQVSWNIEWAESRHPLCHSKKPFRAEECEWRSDVFGHLDFVSS